MARLRVRDPYTREFEIHETAIEYWPDVVVLDRIPDVDDEPDEAESAESPPEESGTPKPGKAAKPAEK